MRRRRAPGIPQCGQARKSWSGAGPSASGPIRLRAASTRPARINGSRSLPSMRPPPAWGTPPFGPAAKCSSGAALTRPAISAAARAGNALRKPGQPCQLSTPRRPGWACRPLDGRRMLIWGGRNSGGLLADGALYDPASNEWSALPLTGAPAARMGAVAEWTGSRLILWGGEGEAGPLNSGAQLTFDAGASPLEWRAFNLTDAPSGRSGHAAVWSGQKMLVWGGQLSGGELLGDGGAYDPINDRWEALPATGAPTARHNHNALWTGQELLVVGGETASGTAASGGAYNPATTQWRALSSAGNPQARSGAAAVWSGAELLTFGGSANGQAVGSLQRLNPQPAWAFLSQAMSARFPVVESRFLICAFNPQPK